MCIGFNPRARAGRDSVPECKVAALLRFNPRARAGRDLPDTDHGSYSVVSIHAPARGATQIDESSAANKQFQSTRPRGARRLKFINYEALAEVSIHAPARGATCVS